MASSDIFFILLIIFQMDHRDGIDGERVNAGFVPEEAGVGTIGKNGIDHAETDGMPVVGDEVAPGEVGVQHLEVLDVLSLIEQLVRLQCRIGNEITDARAYERIRILREIFAGQTGSASPPGNTFAERVERRMLEAVQEFFSEDAQCSPLQEPVSVSTGVAPLQEESASGSGRQQSPMDALRPELDAVRLVDVIFAREMLSERVPALRQQIQQAYEEDGIALSPDRLAEVIALVEQLGRINAEYTVLASRPELRPVIETTEEVRGRMQRILMDELTVRHLVEGGEEMPFLTGLEADIPLQKWIERLGPQSRAFLLQHFQDRHDALQGGDIVEKEYILSDLRAPFTQLNVALNFLAVPDTPYSMFIAEGEKLMMYVHMLIESLMTKDGIGMQQGWNRVCSLAEKGQPAVSFLEASSDCMHERLTAVKRLVNSCVQYLGLVEPRYHAVLRFLNGHHRQYQEKAFALAGEIQGQPNFPVLREENLGEPLKGDFESAFTYVRSAEIFLRDICTILESYVKMLDGLLALEKDDDYFSGHVIPRAKYGTAITCLERAGSARDAEHRTL